MDRPDLVKLITEVCSNVEIMDLKTQQQEEGNTSNCRTAEFWYAMI